MSRRKQSNPKPLKWEECWNEAEDGESRVGKKIPGDTGSPNARPASVTGLESSLDMSPRLKDRARSLKSTSGLCDVEITRIRQKCSSNDNSPIWTKTDSGGPKGGSKGRGQNSSPAVLEPEDSQQSQNQTTNLSKRHDRSMSQSQSPEISVSSTEHNGSPGPFSHHQILQAGLSYLHLLPPAIRNDASRYFMPQMLPPELTAVASQQPSPAVKIEKVAVDNNSRSGPVYMCEPCAIKFSSARTLEAHQTYYCSFRKENGKEGDKSVVKPDSEVIGIKRERESSGEEHELLIDESQDGNSTMTQTNIPLGNKNIKTGKLYTCIYCSYSADKKVSLNRHMRMHSGSMPNSNQPSTSSHQQQQVINSNANPNDDLGGASPSVSSYSSGKNILGGNGPDVSANAVERYCQDCDIQFSSIKTFRVHKQYYCSTRHVLKTQLAATSSTCQPKPGSGIDLSNCSGGSSTPGPHRKGSGSPERSPTPGPGPATPIPTNQPFLVLPTNPVIIVPYCFVQGASILPGNILPNQNAIVVLPNGSVQGLPATPMMMPSPSHSLGVAAAMLLQQHSNPFANHSGGGNPNMNSNSGGTITSTNLSPSGGGHNLATGVFNDPKDIIRRIGGKAGRNHSESDSQRSSSRCQSEKDMDGDYCAEFEVISQHVPAIDLTLRTSAVGDDEKENRELMSMPERRVRPRSVTPNDPDYIHELNSPNSGRLSIGSGKSNERTPRPSSASLSSSCSSPPGHCFSDQPGSAKIVNGVKTSTFVTSVSAKSVSGSATHTQQQQHFTTPNSKGFNGSKGGGGGLDYNYNSSVHDKMRPIATQLPGGAILTSTNNQSLAELLMSNPPDLNESLAKLNSQLATNSPLAGYNLPPPGAFPPELALRLMDPTYLAALQHSFQQQQRQQQQLKQTTTVQLQQQPTPAPAKRGVSKCIDCDIVFYKYENYLVHKERYCAARESVMGTKENQSLECTAVKESISSNSSTKSDCDVDGTGIQCLSPTIQNQHHKTSSAARTQRQQPNSANRSLLCKSSEVSTEIMGNVNTPSLTPVTKTAVNVNVNNVSPPSPIGNKDLKQQQSNQYPCLKCGVKYSTFDNLQTHQTFYCNKRGASIPEPIPSPKSNGGESILFAEQGFLRCGKCRLAIPEEQMNLHATVCQQTPGVGSGNSLMTGTGGTGSGNLGWKCPCCETYSPTMSAAQKHLETHTGIRAFKCLLCGYRGNTLRGMRTHIRMHFDKRVSDLQEGDYIACITSKDLDHSQGAVSANTLTSAAANAAVNAVVTTSTPPPIKINTNVVKVEKESPVVIHIVNNSPPSQSPIGSPSQSQFSPVQGSDLSTTTIRQVENNNRLHFCHLCNYSSSYKGNVVRHMKLVHKLAEDFTEMEMSETGAGNSDERNGDLDDSCGSFESRSRSPDHSNSNLTPSPVGEIVANQRVSTLNNNKGIIASATSPKIKVNGMMEKRYSSRLSASAPLGVNSDDLQLHEEDIVVSNKKEKPCAIKYCKPCGIYFNYLSTFIAHRKLYCPSNARVASDSDPLEQRERAETPVQ